MSTYKLRVLPHIKKLDDCFGQFLVRVICDRGACGEIWRHSRTRGRTNAMAASLWGGPYVSFLREAARYWLRSALNTGDTVKKSEWLPCPTTGNWPRRSAR